MNCSLVQFWYKIPCESMVISHFHKKEDTKKTMELLKNYFTNEILQKYELLMPDFYCILCKCIEFDQNFEDTHKEIFTHDNFLDELKSVYDGLYLKNTTLKKQMKPSKELNQKIIEIISEVNQKKRRKILELKNRLFCINTDIDNNKREMARLAKANCVLHKEYVLCEEILNKLQNTNS